MAMRWMPRVPSVSNSLLLETQPWGQPTTIRCWWGQIHTDTFAVLLRFEHSSIREGETLFSERVHVFINLCECASECTFSSTRRRPLVLGRANAPLNPPHPPTPPHSLGPKTISIANECSSTLKKPQCTSAHPFYMPTKRAISNYSSSYITIFT